MGTPEFMSRRSSSPPRDSATGMGKQGKLKQKRYRESEASVVRLEGLLRYSCTLAVVCIVLLWSTFWLNVPGESGADHSFPVRFQQGAPAALEKEEVPPSLEHCQRYYGNVSYAAGEQLLNSSELAIPPLLLSYPGSGNTYLRAVLEYATSLHSGSVYKHDGELGRLFPGERFCSRELGLIKGHPPDFLIIEEMDSRNGVMQSKKGDKRKRLRPRSRDLRMKCLKGGVKYWTRVIFLARSPFAAILSDSQRQFSGSHTGTVPRTGLNATLKRFGGMKMADLWLSRSMLLANEYNQTFDSVVAPLLDSSAATVPYHGVSTMYVAKFDEIIKDTAGRVDALSRLMRAVYPDLSAPRDKLACAFVLADHRRGILRNGVKKLSAGTMYTDIDPALPCKIFPLVERFVRHPSFNYTESPNKAFPSIFEQCADTRAPGR